jgi:hypothetical protein
MKEQYEFDWENKLRQKPVSRRMFTPQMWYGIENKLQASKFKSFLLRLLVPLCAISALIALFLLLPKDIFNQQKSSSEIQNTMDVIVRKEYITVKPKEWLITLEMPNPNILQIHPRDNETFIYISNGIYSTKDPLKNYLADYYKESHTRDEFNQKMINIISRVQPVEIIGNYNDTTIFEQKYADRGYWVYSFPVIDGVPFGISIFSKTEVSNREQFINKGYYDLMKTIIQNTHPK